MDRRSLLRTTALFAIGARYRLHDGTPTASPVAMDTASNVSLVATGLVNPRGMAFDGNGRLYVAIGGSPGPKAGVAVIEDGCPRVLAGGFPTARVAFRAIAGMADVAFLDGRLYALLAGGNIDDGAMPNGIYEIIGLNDARLIANISAFIRDNPVQSIPGDYDTDGQPYAMLADEDGFLVTEGNSNQLLRIGLDGAIERVADLSEGHPIPTGLARASEVGHYVAYFTSAPYPEGGAKVVSITPDGTVTDTWTGLTLVTALATGADGALYALEMATGYGDDPVGIESGTGRVVRQDGADGVVPVVTGLNLPAAMCFGPDGALYVSGPAFGADTGGGFILRIRVDQIENEPVLAPRLSELALSADC